MAKDKGFDPEGDGPRFRSDKSPSDLPPDQARDFAIRMENVRRARADNDPTKPKKRRAPSKKKIERGLAAQAHMNATQFREPEDRGENPNWVPPAPGTYGGPPLPREKPEGGNEPPENQ